MRGKLHPNRRCPGRWLVLIPLLLLHVQACADADTGDAADPRRPVSLGAPDAVFPEDFGYVHTVRELPGGDVLVADPLGKALYRVDMDAGVRTAVGKLGEGPEEYQQPDAVWPLPGDTTLLVDLGRGQLVRIGPELAFGTAHPIATFQEDGGVVMAMPAGIDLDGNVYTAARGGFPPDPDGRGTILRIGLAEGSVDTAGSFKRMDIVVEETENGVSISPIPLSPQDAWGVAADGYALDGSVTHGDTILHEPVPITTAEKAEYFRDRRRHAGIGMGISSSFDGSTTATFWRGGSGGSEEPDYDNYSWPNVKPALHSATVRVDPSGRAWVKRHLPADTGTAYDLFDRQGAVGKGGDAGGGPTRGRLRSRVCLYGRVQRVRPGVPGAVRAAVAARGRGITCPAGPGPVFGRDRQSADTRPRCCPTISPAPGTWWSRRSQRHSCRDRGISRDRCGYR